MLIVKMLLLIALTSMVLYGSWRMMVWLVEMEDRRPPSRAAINLLGWLVLGLVYTSFGMACLKAIF